jgi:outer membrane protein assembly factor BamE
MFLRVLAAIAALFLVSSCGSARLSAPVVSPYRMEIQQGNFISQEMVSQLKLGMSKDQVRFVLGTPLITDSFHANRWDYVFRRQKSNSSELEHHKLAVIFEDGKLVRVDSDVIPAPEADAAAVKTPEAKKAEAPAAKTEAPAAKPETQTKPPSGALPQPKPAAVEASRPAPAAAPEKSAATPEKPAADQVPAAGKPQQEKKSWWDMIKDAVKF